MLTVGSLFSGIGGLDLGLERAGMKVLWQVENDPYCCKVLEKHWPEVKRFGDIKSLDASTLEPVDLICGGFPCQPVSVAGKRLGTNDPRWLWPEFARCLRAVRPRYVLVENVPGLLVRGMGNVLGDLAACGYDAEWDCLPAGAFGAHFLGYRVFIFAHRSSSCGMRWQGIRENQIRAFAGDEFARLVERELSLCVPASKNQRVSDGISGRVERLRVLGNAVVPQVAEWIGRRIVAMDGGI